MSKHYYQSLMKIINTTLNINYFLNAYFHSLFYKTILMIIFLFTVKDNLSLLIGFAQIYRDD